MTNYYSAPTPCAHTIEKLRRQHHHVGRTRGSVRRAPFPPEKANESRIGRMRCERKKCCVLASRRQPIIIINY